MNAISPLQNNRAWPFFILALLLVLASATGAHAAGYVASITTAYPQLAISSTAPQVVWAIATNTCSNLPSAYRTCDDGISQKMPIGFTFNFGGTNYSNWSMSSNGVIFFETTGAGNSTGSGDWTPANLPTTDFGTPARPAVMPFWADLQKNASANNVLDANSPLQPGDASFYQYETLTLPSGTKVLVVQLRNVKYWNSSPPLFVNLQVQLWSTGEIVYAYGAMQAMTSNPSLRIGLQTGGTSGGCNTLSNTQSTSLSNQSFVFVWDAAAPACPTAPTVNHYEIRHDRAATLCTEPVSVLACSSATAPCPPGNILNNVIVIGDITATGTNVTNVTRSPASFTIQSSTPVPDVNLTWATGSAGTAVLGVSASVAATANPAANRVRCTTANGSAVHANCNMTVTNTACLPPHHFEIIGPTSGTDCSDSTFTIKAWADALQTTAYTSGTVTSGTLTSTGNPASIPNLGAFTIPAGSSTVNITPIKFPSAGTTTFSATGATNAATCKFGSSTSCAFVANACVSDFNCVETVANAATAADSDSQTGRLYTKLAGSALSFDVVARKNNGTQASTYAASADKTVTVSLVDGSGATACASRTALTPAQTQSLTFTSADQGRKTATFTVKETLNKSHSL